MTTSREYRTWVAAKLSLDGSIIEAEPVGSDPIAGCEGEGKPDAAPAPPVGHINQGVRGSLLLGPLQGDPDPLRSLLFSMRAARLRANREIERRLSRRP